MSMTESEAKAILEVEIKHHPEVSIFHEALSTAIAALEEVQQYRAIGLGSPEEVEQDLLLYKADREVLKEYEAIDTVSEFRELKEKEERFDRNIKMFNDINCDIAKKVRAKAITEFAEALRQECLNSPYKEVWLHTILKIAAELKGE